MRHLAPVIVAGFASGAFAGPRDASSVVAGVLARHRVPGLVGAVVELDGATIVGAAGVRKVGSPEPLRVGDAIHLGSDTKAMTATLVAQLVQSGDLKYETTLAEAFPEVAPTMDPAYAKVTVEQVLGHRAALPRDVMWPLYDVIPGGPAAQRLRVVANVLAAKPTETPGAAYAYSNVGYTILGAIVEARAKRSWEETIRTKLFAPLGMTTAGFGPPADAWGHQWDGHAWPPTGGDNPPVMDPAGRVHCSIEDWAKYVAFTLRAQSQDTPALTSAAERRVLTPLPGATYAGGWMLTQRDWAGGPALTHSGSNDAWLCVAWLCVAWLAPTKGFAVIAATNCVGDDAGKACDELVGALMRERGK